MHAMVTEFSAPSAVGPEGMTATEELVGQVNEFLAKGRWSPDMIRVQFAVTPLPPPDGVLVQAFVTHPAPSA